MSGLVDRMSALSRSDLLELQFRKLKARLAHLDETNAFYRQRFDAAGVDVTSLRSLDEFSARVPTMGKPDCLADQAAHPPFGLRLGVPRQQVALVNLTGGTSGQGQEVFGRTRADIVTQGELHFLPWYLAGLREGHAALNCVPAGGLTTGGWGPTEGLRVGGVTPYPVGGTMGTDAKIDLMLRFREIDFIYASTSYMHTLTTAMKRRALDPKAEFAGLSSLFIAAEAYPLEWAREVEAFWGARLHEGYGSTQGAGFIAGTCEEGAVTPEGRGVMHLFEWHNVVEVLDPESGRPAGPGEEGEIVLTNLDIEASPVVRFRTGDKGRYIPASGCRCGRHWAGIEASSITRLDDMMKIRGNNVWPSAIDAVLFRHPSVWEYAGRVFTSDDGKTGVEVRLALRDGSPEVDGDARPLLTMLANEIKAATNVNMALRVVPRSDLPTYDYKSRRWADERAAGFRSGAVAT
jgi:phenylacetate-CoA ligase